MAFEWLVVASLPLPILIIEFLYRFSGDPSSHEQHIRRPETYPLAGSKIPPVIHWPLQPCFLQPHRALRVLSSALQLCLDNSDIWWVWQRQIVFRPQVAFYISIWEKNEVLALVVDCVEEKGLFLCSEYLTVWLQKHAHQQQDPSHVARKSSSGQGSGEGRILNRATWY